MNSLTDNDTRTGTIGGTVLVVLLRLEISQLIDTVVTAATGAAVSYCVAVICKWICRKLAGLRKKDEGPPGSR